MTKALKIPIFIILLIAITFLQTGCSVLGLDKQAKEFTLPDLNGDMVSLSDYQGENIYLNFWASWCEPCIQELPDIEKLYQEYKDKGLVVLTINTGEDRETVSEYIQANSYTFPVLLDMEMNVARQYKTSSIPASVFINKEGEIVTKKLELMTEQQMRKEIEKLLNNQE